MPRKQATEVQAGGPGFLLRAHVFALGAELGWRPDEVVTFAESVTGRSWRACGPVHLEAVRDEYLAIRRAIAAKALRRRMLVNALMFRDSVGGRR
jgi:hypothetical protein